MKKLQGILITTGGILFLLFGLFHLSFWTALNWQNELQKLCLENSNVLQMLNIGSCIILVSFGYLLLFHKKEIRNTRIGKAVLIISGIFFFARLVMEFAFPGGTIGFGIILLICVLIYIIPVWIK